MVAEFINIDLFELGKYDLNLNEYLTLLRYHHDLEESFFPYEPDWRYYERLLADEFIIKKEGGYTLTPKGIRVFEDEEDLFKEFYDTYPHKVATVTGFRPVSAANVDTISAKTTRGIWNRITKNKPGLQRKIIDNLRRELDHRKTEGSLAYLQGIDTWLRQATWEKWDDIPDRKDSSKGYTKL
jgi:hypothetical protein